jgi:endonuclease G
MNLTNFDFIEATEERYSKLNLKKASKQKVNSVLNEYKLNVTERLDHLVISGFEPFDVAKERIVNGNDLMSINYLQLGFLASNSVCRIHVKNINGGNEGFGTGFLISPNLLLTNNHVFGQAEDAVNSLVEFNYQYNVNGRPAISYIFTLNTKKFFYTNQELDFSIVFVNSVTEDKNKNISEFGFLKLLKDPNKALISENVSIIQHPSGLYKQIAIRENQVIAKDGDFITYSTDTAQGSSGSPVFNDQWQVVALHHSGVPRKDKNGNYLCKDGSIFTKNMDDSLIDWIANEGVRISAILNDILKNLNNLQKKFSKTIVDSIFESEIINIIEELKEESIKKINVFNKNIIKMDNKVTFTIPIEISIGIGSNSNLTSPKQEIQVSPKPEQSFVLEKANNQNYKGRTGYDANFVSNDNFKIELKDLLKAQIKKLAPILNPSNDNENFLHYFNFSVAINKSRKLCIMTAVNIDGNRLNPVKRENTKWIIDPRMDEKYQTGPSVYVDNDLDRGHMVRRLDPVWGKNAVSANDDTFHFSNSTPQHKNLNQKTWLTLENYILDNAGNEGIKASVFTGPIFSEDDIPYRGVLLPLQFWKVAVMIKEDGTPSVSGYMLKQPDNIEDFRTMEGIKEDGFREFKTYQVPLQKIANLTGITFDNYNEFDPLNGVDFNETAKLIEITNKTDIKI